MSQINLEADVHQSSASVSLEGQLSKSQNTAESFLPCYCGHFIDSVGALKLVVPTFTTTTPSTLKQMPPPLSILQSWNTFWLCFKGKLVRFDEFHDLSQHKKINKKKLVPWRALTKDTFIIDVLNAEPEACWESADEDVEVKEEGHPGGGLVLRYWCYNGNVDLSIAVNNMEVKETPQKKYG